MSKQKYYTLDRILEKDCQYNVLLGERSNGKSYAVKAYCLERAYKHGEQFAYLRRWREDIKRYLAEGYFNDMEQADNGKKYIYELTEGKYEAIALFQGAFYFANYDEQGNKKKEGKPIGFLFCLTGETHFKSVAYTTIFNFIYEEFITDAGYIPDEPNKLQSLVSTTLRRRKGKVFLIGNTINQVCPYFSEWQLIHVLTQKEGQIDLYHYHTTQIDSDTGEQLVIHIAVEMCPNSGNNSQMFFGRRSEMVTSGKWDTKEFNKLPYPLQEHTILYTMYYVPDSLHRFKMVLLRHKKYKFNMYLFVYPYTPIDKEIPEGARVVDSEPSLDYWHSTSFLHYRTKYDIIVAKYIKEKQICFSDNLTGSNFFNAINNIK